jgi:hypothetical protein
MPLVCRPRKLVSHEQPYVYLVVAPSPICHARPGNKQMQGASRGKAVVLEPKQRAELEAFARSRALPHTPAFRAQIVLSAAEDEENKQIAEATRMTRQTVAKWRQRYVCRGLEGLHDEHRSGRSRSIDDEGIAQMVNWTLQSEPDGWTQ